MRYCELKSLKAVLDTEVDIVDTETDSGENISEPNDSFKNIGPSNLKLFIRVVT